MSRRPAIPGYTLEEVLHRSSRRVVVRARDASGASVVLKTIGAQYPEPGEIAELKREYALMARLQLDGVMPVRARVDYAEGANTAIVMEPFGTSLAQWLATREQPVDVGQALTIAIGVARILGRVHEADVVHKDLVPRNVLYDEASGALMLIDFGIASELARERQDTEIPDRLEGSLPYLSPEQSGRMNRDLDYRADYYALGVTLFELLTGELPFRASSALGWIHQHISRPPPHPSDVRPQVPRRVGDIVVKLLAKDAEDRYQSTFGLIRDLERAREGQAFVLGDADRSRRFAVPPRLFGREDELEVLSAAFDAAASGDSTFLMVGGFSGVGKSVLVKELSRSIAREQGWLLEGKFDQFQQNTPYFAVLTAVRSLARQLMAESDAVLDGYRNALAARLGPNARLLVDLVPELTPVLGTLPEVVALPPVEAQNRLQLAFLDFIGVFAQGKPVVLFLDDLQWSDGPTLALLQRLLTRSDLGKLLMIGTYRDNEVGPGHALLRMVEVVRERRRVEDLVLQPLDREAVGSIVAATVQQTGPQVDALADRLFHQAGGNPFFVTELLRHLYATGRIRFDPDVGRWTWELEAIAATPVGESVVAFLVANLRRLEPEVQETLMLAACIGNSFELHTLATIRGITPEAVHQTLLVAMKSELVAPLGEGYRYAGQGSGAQAHYRFQHDRVQQAAYALIEPERRREVHLRIGRLLWADLDEDELAERRMEVVGHLNEGRLLIVDPVERQRLVTLNVQAATQARDASAWEASRGFLQVALELLPDDAWKTRPARMWEVAEQLQDAAYLTGDQAEAERWSAELEARAADDLARAEVLAVRTRQYSTRGKMAESMRSAIAGLLLLGVRFEEDPDAAAVAREAKQVEQNLAGRPIEGLIHAPAVTDRRQLLAMRLLMEIFPAAFLSGSGQLFPYLVLKAVSTTLVHGNAPESAFAYAAYGMLLCGALDDPARGLKYGKLAVRMNEELDDIGLKSRVLYVYTMFVHHWSHHWSTMTRWFQRGIDAGHRSGDLLYLAYSAQDCIIWDPRLDLPNAARQQQAYLRVVADTGYQDSYDSGSLFLQLQLNLMGRTRDTFSMDTEAFDEEAVMAGIRDRGFMTGVANHHIYKAEIHCCYGDFEGALPHVVAMEGMLASAMSLPQLVRFHVVAFLTRASLLPTHPNTDGWRESLEAGRDRMARWAAHCPVNFAHLAALMEAELAAIDGQLDRALERYGTAIDEAVANGWTRDAATAHERAAQLLLARNLDRAAEGYLRASHHLFRRWGASRKVAQLEEQHPFLHSQGPSLGETVRASSGKIELMRIDLDSVIRASQAIRGELVLQQLWVTTLSALMENAGAQRGCFVQQTEQGWRLQAVSGDLEGRWRVPEELEENGPVPLSMVRAALRSREAIVLSDARRQHRFQADPSLQLRRPRSVLVVPMVQRALRGAICLENDGAAGTFTAERVAVLELLAAQALVSTANAELARKEREAVELSEQLAVESQHKSRHLADMSHELRTPLNAIIGYSELLAEEVRDEGLEDLLPDLERIETAAHFLLRLINGVLDLSKIEAGRMEVRAQSIELDPLLKEIGTTLTPVANKKGNRLTWDGGGLTVLADGLRVRQILTNLIGNAAKFTEQGLVEVRAVRDDGQVRVHVRDTGTGIGPEALVTLFEPYQQASADTAASFGGTGLGLAIAVRLAELMGGALTATSTLGVGSTFTLTLPHPDSE